jgi:hypothetical protein
MPFFIYRCLSTGQRVQGFVAEDIAEDHHVYVPVTCLACRQIHHVNPTTGVVLGEKAK